MGSGHGMFNQDRTQMKELVVNAYYRRPAPKRLAEFGFTIIEVLIVLAIAGLILLIVFLAVPALQRNSRNTQRRTEAARVLAITQENVNNSGGILPNAGGSTNCAGTGGGATNCDKTASPNNAMQLWQLANMKTLDGLTILAAGTVAQQTPVLTAGNASQAFLDTGVKCGTVAATTVTPTTTGANVKSLILIYAIEDQSGNPIAQCVAS